MHSRKRLRLAGHDYAQPGAYFVTLCAVDRQCIFGDIVDTSMRLNDAGELVARIWRGLPTHLKYLTLDELVLMPNHFHGVLVFEPGNQHALPNVIRSFKVFTTRAVGRPIWQRSYHDRIVRGDDELARIREYIANNPAQWAIDEENPDRKR